MSFKRSTNILVLVPTLKLQNFKKRTKDISFVQWYDTFKIFNAVKVLSWFSNYAFSPTTLFKPLIKLVLEKFNLFIFTVLHELYYWSC